MYIVVSTKPTLMAIESLNQHPDLSTVTEVLQYLGDKGYNLNFKIKESYLICDEDQKCTLNPSEFEIDYIFRFEGATNPDDEEIVYALSSHLRDVKGVIVNAFGPNADSVSAEMIEKLRYRYNPKRSDKKN